MCGIAGFIGSHDVELLRRMGAAQEHRGPDGAGVWTDGQAGLSHVRLAIIDVSEAGSQPMWDAEARVAISFNGEIYNYRELRAFCERLGVTFKGASDTEVLVNLLAKFGTACLPWLNGIFAFAAWFPAEKEMIIARDSAGVKPLYWANTAEGVGFASEIKALRCVPGIDLSIDPLAIAAYLSLLHAPGELTPVKGIRKVLPGTYLRVSVDGSITTQGFAPKHYSQDIQALSRSDAIEACRHYLNQAVRRQLMSDVPLGGFLSGGTDSTAVAHFAVKNLTGPEAYPCFTVGPVAKNALAEEGFTDDYPYADYVSRNLGLTLHVAQSTPIAIDSLDWMIWQLDEPTPDLAPFVAHSICRIAQERGVKVLLSGAGGDDIFSGYRRHLAISYEPLWDLIPMPLRSGLRRLGSQTSTTSPLLRRFTKLVRYADALPADRLAGYFLWLHADALMPILSQEMKSALGLRRPADILTNSLAELPEGVSRLNQMLHLDRSFFLVDHNLNYTDKVSMACGVEVRVPFLDAELISFSERLPDSLKQHGREGKYVLREAMRGLLPNSILDRAKTGFGLPLRGLMRGAYGRRVEELARSGRLAATGVFDPQGVLALLEADRRGEIDAAYPLFGVLCVESWLRQFAGK